MREILFRGKAEDGNWHEGWFCGQTCHTIFAPAEESAQIIRKDDLLWAEVIPETVGQYTGLKDKNGKKIFEGDILEAHYDEEYPANVSRSVVEWKEFGWAFKDLSCNDYDYIDAFATEYNEVVGNIYDNPELLEVEK